MRDEDEELDAEITAEEILGKPLARSSTEGERAMQHRIALLRGRLVRLHPDAGDEAEIELIREIREAQARLKAYQTQIEGKN